MRPITFRLYPEKRTLYFAVNVWPTRKAMISRLRELAVNVHDGMQAACSTWERTKYRKGKPARKRPVCGELNFHRERLSIEIASHEITHATVGWARRMQIDPMTIDDDVAAESDDNERFAYAQGRMVAQFNHQAYRRKAWPGL